MCYCYCLNVLSLFALRLSDRLTHRSQVDDIHLPIETMSSPFYNGFKLIFIFYTSFGNLRSYTFFLSILLTHEGSHREVYRDFQPCLTSSASPVPRVVQTTGSVHPKPILPNCQLKYMHNMVIFRAQWLINLEISVLV